MKSDKFQDMINRIYAGETLILATVYHATRITKANMLAWAKADRPLLKNDKSESGGFWVASGKQYVYCAPGGMLAYFESEKKNLLTYS